MSDCSEKFIRRCSAGEGAFSTIYGLINNIPHFLTADRYSENGTRETALISQATR